MQISWTICLFGTLLTYACQNVQNFSFDKDTRNISRRYKDFITILVMSLIVKRFVNGVKPYTSEELSLEYQIPIRLTKQILNLLLDIGFINESVEDDKSEEIHYLPAFDVNKMNVALLFERIDVNGSENFKIDKEDEFKGEWKGLIDSRKDYYQRTSKILLKDL